MFCFVLFCLASSALLCLWSVPTPGAGNSRDHPSVNFNLHVFPALVSLPFLFNPHNHCPGCPTTSRFVWPLCRCCRLCGQVCKLFLPALCFFSANCQTNFGLCFATPFVSTACEAVGYLVLARFHKLKVADFSQH